MRPPSHTHPLTHPEPLHTPIDHPTQVRRARREWDNIATAVALAEVGRAWLCHQPSPFAAPQSRRKKRDSSSASPSTSTPLLANMRAMALDDEEEEEGSDGGLGYGSSSQYDDDSDGDIDDNDERYQEYEEGGDESDSGWVVVKHDRRRHHRHASTARRQHNHDDDELLTSSKDTHDRLRDEFRRMAQTSALANQNLLQEDGNTQQQHIHTQDNTLSLPSYDILTPFSIPLTIPLTIPLPLNRSYFSAIDARPGPLCRGSRVLRRMQQRWSQCPPQGQARGVDSSGGVRRSLLGYRPKKTLPSSSRRGQGLPPQRPVAVVDDDSIAVAPLPLFIIHRSSPYHDAHHHRLVVVGSRERERDQGQEESE